MAKILLLLLFLGSISVITHTNNLLGPASMDAGHFIADKGKEEFARLQKQASVLKAFALKKGYSTSYCMLADLELPSGKNRFFVYDLNKDSIVLSALVAHGSCNSMYLEKAWFSNEPGCGCSSSGVYKIGGSYSGRFGKAFKLFGLDSTNSNAYKRSIVLHCYPQVPDHEIYPDELGNSLGCPMVATKTLQKTAAIIERSNKPILLWVF